MQKNNDQQDAINQLRVADHTNNPQGSLASSQTAGVPQSFASHSLDYESQVSMEISLSNQRKLSSTIAALRRDDTEASAAPSTTHQGLASEAGYATADPNNQMTSMLLAQLFDFTQNIVGYSIDSAAKKNQAGVDGSATNASMNATASMSIKLASLSASLQHDAESVIAEQSRSASLAESLQHSQLSTSLSLLQDSISQSLSESASLASQQQADSLAAAATKPNFVPELAEHSFKDAVLSKQSSQPSVEGQLAKKEQVIPAVGLKADKQAEMVELRQKVHRTIIFNLPSGELKTEFQSHTFTRRGKKNLQTGEVTWLGWDDQRYVLPAYVIPNLIGYQHYPAQIPPLVVYPNGKDSTVQVKYKLEPVKKPKKVKHFGETQTTEKQPAIDHQKLNEEIKEEAEKDEPLARVKRNNKSQEKHLSFFGIIGRAFLLMFTFAGKSTKD